MRDKTAPTTPSIKPAANRPTGAGPAPPRPITALANGMLGVLIFSGSLPATRAAVAGFDPLFLTAARAVVAALIGMLLLLVLRQTGSARPNRGDAASLILIAGGVVIGFPLLTAMALQFITAAHAIVYIGLLPLVTAAFGVLRGHERPRPLFWLFSGTGGLAVALFAISENAGLALSAQAVQGDLMMLAAILCCGLGYAEGGILSRRLGGWQVISWALIIALPVMVALAIATLPDRTGPRGFDAVPLSAWVGFGYVAIFSMMLGFVFWYRGLALGRITLVSQLQLLQPFMGLGLAALVLGEVIATGMIWATLAVVGCVLCARRFA